MIKLTINNTEVTFNWNASMRRADFMVLNKITDEATAIQCMEACSDAYKTATFQAIKVGQVAKLKESVVSKKGNFVVKQDVVSFRKVGNHDDHLFAAYIDKLNARHSKMVEDVAVFRAGLNKQDQKDQQIKSDAGQTEAAKQPAATK